MLQNISISLSNKLDFLFIRNSLKSHGVYRIKQLNIYKKQISILEWFLKAHVVL